MVSKASKPSHYLRTEAPAISSVFDQYDKMASCYTLGLVSIHAYAEMDRCCRLIGSVICFTISY